MKITHYSQNTHQEKQLRNQKGRYKNKSRGAGKLLILIIIAGIAIVGFKYYPKVQKPITDHMVEIKSSDGLTEEQQVKLKKQYELSIKETTLMNKKSKLDADYKTQSANIELELEAVRSEKISFQ